MLAFEQLKDPFGIAFWPAFEGRDGCRTPHALGRPRRPRPASPPASPGCRSPRATAAAPSTCRSRTPGSVLNTTRAFLNWRRERQPLRTGSIRFLRATGDVLAFERASEADRILCLFNLGGEPQRYRAAEPHRSMPASPARARRSRAARVELPPWGFAFAHLE